MGMIVCLTGSTCTGKTSIATRLANDLGWPLRSCGSSIRRRAADLGVALEALDDGSHRLVDAETVAWALGSQDCLVEGRFLDSVFHDSTMPVRIIRMEASYATRAERGTLRGKSTFAVNDVIRVDAEDAAFRERLYPWIPLPPSFPAFDNSGLTVDECVRRVRASLGGALPQPG